MQKSKIFVMLLAITIMIGTLATSTAFAAEDISDTELEAIASDSIASTITIAGTGMVSGAALSIFRVIGKHVKTAKPEGFAFNKFLATVIVGGAVGAVLGYLGVSSEAAIGIDFMTVFFLSQTLFPIMQNRKWKVK
mgnify:CR=1 FL=1